LAPTQETIGSNRDYPLSSPSLLFTGPRRRLGEHGRIGRRSLRSGHRRGEDPPRRFG